MFGSGSEFCKYMTFTAVTSTIVSPIFAICRMAMDMCTNMRVVGEKAET
jgi:hypothetical protein